MNKNWSNTVLVAYSALPKIANQLDSGVKTRINSSFQSKHIRNGVSTEQLIGEIISINDEKRRICNLRFIVSAALNKMPLTDRRLLIARIVRKHTFQKIADDFGLSLRTVFRRIEHAEECFASNLKAMGYTEEWLKKEYGNDRFILPVYNRIISEKYFIAKNL